MATSAVGSSRGRGQPDRELDRVVDGDAAAGEIRQRLAPHVEHGVGADQRVAQRRRLLDVELLGAVAVLGVGEVEVAGHAQQLAGRDGRARRRGCRGDVGLQRAEVAPAVEDDRHRLAEGQPARPAARPRPPTSRRAAPGAAAPRLRHRRGCDPRRASGAPSSQVGNVADIFTHSGRSLTIAIWSIAGAGRTPGHPGDAAVRGDRLAAGMRLLYKPFGDHRRAIAARLGPLDVPQPVVADRRRAAARAADRRGRAWARSSPPRRCRRA